MGLLLQPAHQVRHCPAKISNNSFRLSLARSSLLVRPKDRVLVTAQAVLKPADTVDLPAAIDRWWPIDIAPNGTFPEHIVLNCVANFLLEQQGYKASLSAAASAVNNKWGWRSALGIDRSFKAILQDYAGFSVVGTNGKEVVTLNTTELQQAIDQHMQVVSSRGSANFSSSSSSTSSSSSSIGSDSVSSTVDRALLRQLVTALWPKDSSDPAVRVKRCMADLLLAKHDLKLRQGLISKVRAALGTAESLGISGFEKVLTQDPSGCFVINYQASPPFISLDGAALHQYAQQQGVGDSSSDGDDGSSSDGGSSDSEESILEEQESQELSFRVRMHLWQLAATVWPIHNSDPAVQAKRFMASELVHEADLTVPRAAMSQLSQALGSAESHGFSSWRSLLSQDPCFVFGEGPSGESSIRLDAAMLRQRASQGAAGSSGHGDSSSGDSSTSDDLASSGSSSSSGGDSRGNSSGSNGMRSASQEQESHELSTSERVQLWQLIPAVWPSDSSDPAVQARASMARLLLHERDLTLPQGDISQLGLVLGGAKSLGISSWSSVLSKDPCFVFGEGPSGDLTIRLDAALLRQRAHEQSAAGISTVLKEQRQALSASSSLSTTPVARAALAQASGPDDASSQRLPPVTQLLFELQLQQGGSGWLQPSYILHPQQLQQAAQQPRRLFGRQQQHEQPAATAAEGSAQQLVGVRGSQPVLQEWEDSSTSSSNLDDEAAGQQEEEEELAAAASAEGQGEVGSSEGSESEEEGDEGLSGEEEEWEEEGGEGLSDVEKEEWEEEGEVGVSGGDAEQQEPWQLEGFSSSTGDETGLGSNLLSSYESGPAEGQDEAVWSMARLLPARLRADLEPFMSLDASPSLEEVIVDKGKPVVLRLSDRSSRILGYSVDLVEALVLLEAAQQQWQAQGRVASFDDEEQQPYFADISYAEQSAAYRHAKDFAALFRQDGRMGVPGTLHRISVLRNVAGTPTGLTYRLGRHVPDNARLVADILSSMKASIMPGSPVERAQSLLVLGKPGTGKTTLLRDIVRIMSTPPQQGGLGLAVLIVDTSNEIAGDADECHPCIGYARRLMVPRREQQADILVQAVQNHNPDVIIVDEIGTKQEVEAARTIAERGVVLVGTAHGNNLSNLMRNPVLRPLVGGINAITIGDAMAAKTNSNNKTRMERGGAATFVSLLELNSRDTWRLHLDVEQSVDLLLASPSELTAALDPYSKLTGAAAAAGTAAREPTGVPVNTQVRSKDPDGRLWVQFESPGAAEQTLAAAGVVEQLGGGVARL